MGTVQTKNKTENSLCPGTGISVQDLAQKRIHRAETCRALAAVGTLWTRCALCHSRTHGYLLRSRFLSCPGGICLRHPVIRGVFSLRRTTGSEILGAQRAWAFPATRCRKADAPFSARAQAELGMQGFGLELGATLVVAAPKRG